MKQTKTAQRAKELFMKHNELYYLNKIIIEYIKHWEIPTYYYTKYSELLDRAIDNSMLSEFEKCIFIEYKRKMWIDQYTLVFH